MARPKVVQYGPLTVSLVRAEGKGWFEATISNSLGDSFTGEWNGASYATAARNAIHSIARSLSQHRGTPGDYGDVQAAARMFGNDLWEALEVVNELEEDNPRTSPRG